MRELFAVFEDTRPSFKEERIDHAAVGYRTIYEAFNAGVKTDMLLGRALRCMWIIDRESEQGVAERAYPTASSIPDKVAFTTQWYGRKTRAHIEPRTDGKKAESYRPAP
jgi:hypothetical protein